MSRSRKKIVLLLAAILLVAATLHLQSRSVAPLLTQKDSQDWPSRRELGRSFWRSGKLLIVYATADSGATKTYVKFAQTYANGVSWLQVTAKADTAVSFSELKNAPLMLIGSTFRNERLRELLARVPARAEPGRFTFGRQFSSQPGDVFVLSLFPNPLALQMPLTVFGGADDKAVSRFLRKSDALSAQAGEFRVFRDGRGILLGFFKQEKGGPWRIDESRTRFYGDKENNTVRTDNYRVIYHGANLSPEALKHLARRQQELFEKMQDRLAAELPRIATLPEITLRLYESAEDKGLITGNTDLAHIEVGKWTIHAIYNDVLNGADFFADARLILSKLLGSSASAALRDGLAISFSDKWSKSGYRCWSKRYFDAGTSATLSELLSSSAYSKESYLLMRPEAGTFTDFLVEKYGLKTVLKLYRVWPSEGLPKANLPEFTLPRLEKSWRLHVKTLDVDTSFARSRQRPAYPTFQKGFSYAHEGYQIYNGYMSRKSKASLTRLRNLGANWISLTPFGYLDDKNKPGYLRFSFGAGSENDESLVTALAHSRQLGMRALLKPHVLLNSRHFGWPGDVEMKTDADWARFFHYYERWILHYAVLGEIYDFDILCVGTELLHTTKTHAEEWRRIIRRIRRLYQGRLVYAANWWQEFEQITFWDELDYIGMNCYHPLSDSDSATLEELKQGMQKIAQGLERTAQKYDRPVILTEIGFTSTERSWKQPHEDGRGKPPYFGDQEKCYRAVFETLWRKPWFYGFYWWKWPTYLERGGMRHSSFTPNGKPAEKVLAKWYAKTWKPRQ